MVVAQNLIFFLQAEDGIRDTSVTGVQTCALPISEGVSRRADRGARPGRAAARAPDRRVLQRSEERRVGKECTTRRRDAPEEKRTGEQTHCRGLGTVWRAPTEQPPKHSITARHTRS